ncbi:MAG: GLPGLI family protein [Flavobacteriales bacterium]
MSLKLKTGIIAFALCCANNVLLSQSGVVKYDFFDMQSGVAYRAELLFQVDKALFVTMSDSLQGHLDERKTVQKEDGSMAVVSLKTYPEGRFVFESLQSERIKSNFGGIYMSEKTPRIDWRITDRKKTLGPYDVIKAVAKFRGRAFEAWFAPEIPFPYGPWKLQGLPGLILEAYDTGKYEKLRFRFSGIEYPKAVKIAPPKSKTGRWLSLSAYQKALENLYRKNTAYTRSIAERFGGEADVPTKLEYQYEVFD